MTREHYNNLVGKYVLPNASQLIDYIVDHQPVGSFLQAVIANDLKETFAHADDFNRHVVRDYVAFMYEHAPYSCWGSRGAYDTWITPKETTDDEE